MDGKALTAVIPTYLKSAAMTAEWENRLLLIERGQLDGKEFLEGVTELVKTVMEGCKEIPEEELQRFHPREQIGICPLCGSPVYEGKQNFYCSSRECSFALWKENHYLSGMAEYEDVVYSTNIPNGYMVPCTQLLENPSALLEDVRFKELLNTLSENYRFVIIDSPPLGSVADGALIASLCDGAVLVVRAGTTPRTLIKQSLL